MTKNFESYSKNNVSYLLLGVALFFCTVFSGGLSWHGCLISLLVLTALYFVHGREAGLCVFTVCFVLLTSSCVSLLWTLGNVQDGIYEFVKFLCFVSAVCVAKSMCDSTKILRIIFFNALAVAIVGLFACCDIFNADEFTFYDGNVLRLQSFIKYANSTASFLGCGYIAFLELFRIERKRSYLFGGGCILIALYFTFSKACIPIFLMISVAYLFFNRALCSVFLFHNIISASALCIMLLLAPQKMWFLLFVLTALAVFLSGNIRLREEKVYFVAVCIAVPLFLVLAVAVIALIKPSLFYTFAVRLTYMKDSLSLIPRHLLFGNGFGSWRVLQYGIQTTQYNVTYLHNCILQMLFENGAIFTLTFLSLCGYSVIMSVKKRDFAFASVILLILTHSLSDCDLSFGTLLMVLGLAVGCSLSNRSEQRPKMSFVNSVTFAVVAAMFAFSDIYAISEYAVRSSFENAYLSGDYKLAEQRLESLLKICPSDAGLMITSAALHEKNDAQMSVILEDIKTAAELSPCEPGIYEAYVNYNIDAANAELVCKKYLDMAPKQERTYAFLKQYLSRCVDRGKITNDEFSFLSDFVEQRRIKEKVTDRDALLSELAGIQ